MPCEPITTATRIAIVGDVGGHLAELEQALANLGWSGGDLLPEDLAVIQVGDLIHRGPASSEVVALVDRLLTHNPGRWLQLMGNHEAQYVRRPAFHWDETLPEETATTIRRWWSEGSMVLAAAIPAASRGGLLVTHAGLTRGCWDRLGRPRTALEAAATINAAAGDEHSPVWAAGCMLYGALDTGAGPLWAEAASELDASWQTPADEGRIFDQVHGHSSPYNWFRGTWRTVPGPNHRIDHDRRHSRREHPSHTVTGIDPGHGRRPAPRWQPLVHVP